MTSIVIVGSGVLGLSTALAICENLTTPFNLTIIGEYGPHDPQMNTTLSNHVEYTSPWAGAHFRPFPSKSTQEFNEMLLTRITQDRFKKFTVEEPESSIKFIKGIEYLEDPDNWYSNFSIGWKEQIDDFEIITENLPPKVKLAVKYTTWVVNPPIYLQFLYRKLFARYKVEFIQSKLQSLKQVNEIILGNPIIINCTGTGLQYNGGHDSKCYPIRGQTLLVRPPATCKIDATITHQLKDGIWTFCIPRPFDGGMILGGTKQINDTYSGVKDQDTRQLIKHGKQLFPEFFHPDGSLEIVRVNVGFRPARHGGLNVSTEEKCNTHYSNHIIHNYGSGGMGYELSYGSGMKVVEKLQQLLIKEKTQTKVKL